METTEHLMHPDQPSPAPRRRKIRKNQEEKGIGTGLHLQPLDLENVQIPIPKPRKQNRQQFEESVNNIKKPDLSNSISEKQTDEGYLKTTPQHEKTFDKEFKDANSHSTVNRESVDNQLHKSTKINQPKVEKKQESNQQLQVKSFMKRNLLMCKNTLTQTARKLSNPLQVNRSKASNTSVITTKQDCHTVAAACANKRQQTPPLSQVSKLSLEISKLMSKSRDKKLANHIQQQTKSPVPRDSSRERFLDRNASCLVKVESSCKSKLRHHQVSASFTAADLIKPKLQPQNTLFKRPKDFIKQVEKSEEDTKSSLSRSDSVEYKGSPFIYPSKPKTPLIDFQSNRKITSLRLIGLLLSDKLADEKEVVKDSIKDLKDKVSEDQSSLRPPGAYRKFLSNSILPSESLLKTSDLNKIVQESTEKSESKSIEVAESAEEESNLQIADLKDSDKIFEQSQSTEESLKKVESQSSEANSSAEESELLVEDSTPVVEESVNQLALDSSETFKEPISVELKPNQRVRESLSDSEVLTIMNSSLKVSTKQAETSLSAFISNHETNSCTTSKSSFVDMFSCPISPAKTETEVTKDDIKVDVTSTRRRRRNRRALKEEEDQKMTNPSVVSDLKQLEEKENFEGSQYLISNFNLKKSSDEDKNKDSTDDVIQEDHSVVTDDVIQEDDVVVTDDVIQEDHSVVTDDVIQEDDVVVTDDVIQEDDVVVTDDVIQEDHSVVTDDVIQDEVIVIDDVIQDDGVVVTDDVIQEDDFVVTDDVIQEDEVVVTDDVTPTNGGTQAVVTVKATSDVTPVISITSTNDVTVTDDVTDKPIKKCETKKSQSENFCLERLDEYDDIEFLKEMVFDKNNSYEDRKKIRKAIRLLKAKKAGTTTSSSSASASSSAASLSSTKSSSSALPRSYQSKSKTSSNQFEKKTPAATKATSSSNLSSYSRRSPLDQVRKEVVRKSESSKKSSMSSVRPKKIGSIFDREEVEQKKTGPSALQRLQAEKKKELSRIKSSPSSTSRDARNKFVAKLEGDKKIVRTPSAIVPGANNIKQRLLRWATVKTSRYPHVNVTNYSSSWADGMAFCALVHAYFPEAFDFSELDPSNRAHNFELAFNTAEKVASVAQLLDVEDMLTDVPDWKCVYTYLTELYKGLVENNSSSK